MSFKNLVIGFTYFATWLRVKQLFFNTSSLPQCTKREGFKKNSVDTERRIKSSQCTFYHRWIFNECLQFGGIYVSFLEFSVMFWFLKALKLLNISHYSLNLHYNPFKSFKFTIWLLIWDTEIQDITYKWLQFVFTCREWTIIQYIKLLILITT